MLLEKNKEQKGKIPHTEKWKLSENEMLLEKNKK